MAQLSMSFSMLTCYTSPEGTCQRRSLGVLQYHSTVLQKHCISPAFVDILSGLGVGTFAGLVSASELSGHRRFESMYTMTGCWILGA